MIGWARRPALAALVLAGVAAPAVASANCSVSQVVELKVTMRGNGALVPLIVNGHEERFLVDSGAFHSAISPGVATELGLPLSSLPDGFMISGIGGDVVPQLGIVKQLGLAGVTLKNVQFVVGGSEIGDGAAGLLGQNVLGLADVEYDFGHSAVRLMRSKDCKKVAPVYWTKTKPISTIELDRDDREQRHTVGTIWINGVRMRAVFDTGANHTMLSLTAAARLGMKPGDGKVEAAGYSYGIGRKRIPTFRVPIDTIKLGDNEEIRRTHLEAGSMDLGADLLVGADFFLSHRVYVANALSKLFFTYEGGPIFGTSAHHVDTAGKDVAAEADTTATPADAAGLARRGAVALSRHDLKAALADLDKAVAMAPDDAQFLTLRARALIASDQPHRAMEDLDRALTLAPGDSEARIARAELRLEDHDRKGAAADAEAIAGAAAPAADVRLDLAELYSALQDRPRAIAQFDLWLRYHRDDFRVPNALNGRCWARAEANLDLDKALSDCNASIRAQPNAGTLDSRGLVYLRMGDNAKALRDYDAALAKAPKLAGSLYARGIVKRRLGDAKGGDADTTAALALDREVAQRMKDIGIKD